MFQIKTLSKEAIPKALERVERYRLLNEPAVAVSICQDILQVEPGHQQALVMLILALTDQFSQNSSGGINQALGLIPRLRSEYERAYYTGIIHERQARARLNRSYPGSEFDAHDLLREAMAWFEKAETLRAAGDEDAVLRWNTCARIVMERNLRPRPRDDSRPSLE